MKKMQDEALADMISNSQSDNPEINKIKYKCNLYKYKIIFDRLVVRFICFLGNYLMMSSLLLEKTITGTRSN